MRTRKTPIGDANVCGPKIGELLKDKGWTHLEFLARLYRIDISVNPSGLSKIFGGTRFIRDKELRAMAEVLEVPVETLFQ